MATTGVACNGPALCVSLGWAKDTKNSGGANTAVSGAGHSLVSSELGSPPPHAVRHPSKKIQKAPCVRLTIIVKSIISPHILRVVIDSRRALAIDKIIRLTEIFKIDALSLYLFLLDAVSALRVYPLNGGLTLGPFAFSESLQNPQLRLVGTPLLL